MNPKLKSKDLDCLFKAISLLENEEEYYNFFEDLCTITELNSLGQRLMVAKLLRKNHTYQDICDSTGASTATISRINKCLTYGADGYKMVLDRLGDDEL